MALEIALCVANPALHFEGGITPPGSNNTNYIRPEVIEDGAEVRDIAEPVRDIALYRCPAEDLEKGASGGIAPLVEVVKRPGHVVKYHADLIKPRRYRRWDINRGVEL